MDIIDTSRLKAVLRYRIPGIEIIWKEETGSTNEDLFELAHYGIHGWTVLGADFQTSGKGRHSRRWISPSGGLYVSVLLRLEDESSPITLMPLVVGIAIKEAIESEASSKGGIVKPRLKWPNDLLTENGKLAGILCESTESEKGWVIVVGIGVNISPLDDEKQRQIDNPVTSLSEESDIPWTRAGLLTTFLVKLAEKIEDWQNDPDKICDTWMTASGAMGKKITVITHSGEVEGVVRGLAKTGALRVLNDSGKEIEINSSEGIIEHG